VCGLCMLISLSQRAVSWQGADVSISLSDQQHFHPDTHCLGTGGTSKHGDANKRTLNAQVQLVALKHGQLESRLVLNHNDWCYIMCFNGHIQRMFTFVNIRDMYP